MDLMDLLLHVSSANVKHLFTLLDMLRVCEFIQSLLPLIDLIRLLFRRRVVFFLSFVNNLMLLRLPHWRNIALYLRIDRFTDWLLLDLWLAVNLLHLLRLTIDLYILYLFVFLSIVDKDLRLLMKCVYFLDLLLNFL